MKTSDFVGLTKKRAQDLAEASNLIFRLVEIDGTKFLGLPEDTVVDRVCIVIKDGKVSDATFQ